MNTSPPPADERQPTRWQALLFMAKACLLRLRRRLHDPQGRPVPMRMSAGSAAGPVLAESRSLLYPSAAGAEFSLQVGKVQNLRVASRCLHGRVLRAGELFSFWAHVPRPSVRRGFAPGRELREGCVIPNVGGGLCQLSNALYDAALTSGCEIVERHAHSRRLPGSMAAAGRDATIFWNYVDLRFRALVDCQLEVWLTKSELRLRLRALEAGAAPRCLPPAPAPSIALHSEHPAESCETCGVISCFRNPAAAGLTQQAVTAWLVDAWWPEHDAWMTSQRQHGDTLLTPLDRQRWKAGPYQWNSAGFDQVRSAPLFTLRRSFVSRRLAGHGAARQRALLRMDAELAAIYARRIPHTALHVVVSQNLLPFLWQSGALAGRTFDVLMTRLPMAALQAQLDRAAARWPDTPTLADFRADPAVLAAESAALAEARHWITPHREVARLAGPRAILLDWHLPAARRRPPGRRLVFPASTLSRKGALEVRETLRGLRSPVTLAGPLLEGADFWNGTRTQPASDDWLADAAAVVLPGWVENQPRRLLAALAAGVPVICTPACGLSGMPGVTLVPEGDSKALWEALEWCLATPQRGASPGSGPSSGMGSSAGTTMVRPETVTRISLSVLLPMR